jgi:hypothetical protein
MPRTGAYIGSGDFTSQVVLLPYCNPGDMVASNAGKIILCNVKPGFAPPMLIDKMLEYKAAGFLLIYDKGPYARSGYGIGELIDMPVFRISPEVTEDILRGSGYTLENLDQLKAPLMLSTTVHMAASFEFSMTSARNVLGLLPGSDPLHKDEIVVIGAHYDHVGRDPDGTIYNGANDNASGVAEMLEVARLWQSQGFRPARSVLFAAWDAEEEGYFGSFNYVTDPDNLLFQKTVAMLNLDMAGIGETIFIAGQSTMTDQLQASATALGYTVNYDPAGGSDDISFQDAGIPAGLVSIDPDTYEEMLLHRPDDDPQKIHLKSLRMVGVVTAHALAAWSGGGPRQLQD